MIPNDYEARGSRTQQMTGRAAMAILAALSFALYLWSSLALEARGATLHFGADAHLYAPLAEGHIEDRVARFHPVTVGMAFAWLAIFRPLMHWFSAQQLLKAMFAAAGAAGVLAAMACFARLVPRRYVVPCGAVYAMTLGIWYFSSIEESKILSASLTALYMACYLRLRDAWTAHRVMLLSVVLLVACLNEFVAFFLLAIPFVDTLARFGIDWRQGRWIFLHAAVAPLALIILEGVVNGWMFAAGVDPEGKSHLSMLIFYVLESERSLFRLYAFLLDWLFFNIAAPVASPQWVFPPYGGYFDPALVHYRELPASAGAIFLLYSMLLVWGVPAWRPAVPNGVRAFLLGVAAFGCLRTVFFLVFNPEEPLLFSPSSTLAHLLLMIVPFALSSLPARGLLLAAVAGLLYLGNGAFIFGR